MYKICLFLFSCLFSPSCFCITTDQPSCFFTPPPGWDFADPKILAPRVKIAFVGKTKQALAPSIILAAEEIKVGLPEYLKAVQAIYERTRKTSWRSMGLIKTQAGPAHLLQIDTETKYGPLRKLQLIFIKENKAYILTTTALKKEFSSHLEAFQKTLSSFTCTCDLYASLPKELKTGLESLETALLKKWNTLEKTSFEEMFNQTEFQEIYWLPLQKKVLEDCQKLGAYWQMIVLRSIRENLHESYFELK
ncbi:MAG TPA: hypothetical protein VGZ69_04265 [Candidatus Rhabdochlamydia sp.]|jgi:hypothetical protein|nr:hypothetical protein [Candidatus Rhabdochlamydia sp.]